MKTCFFAAANWEFVSDRVMGGISEGALRQETVSGRSAERLTGRVSLENNGGFVQMACDLALPAGDHTALWQGIVLDIHGNDQAYDVRLRTTDLARPWQSFRTQISAASRWQTLHLPFADFAPHRTQANFEPSRLRRIGILAIGRVFDADVAVAQVGFYRE